MSVIPSTEMYTFDINDLHPKMRSPVRTMIISARAFRWKAKGLTLGFEPFEGYRSPVRQAYLKTVRKTSKAGPWESAHQYGLAVDFACRVIEQDGLGKGWTWPEDAPWPVLKRFAEASGLTIPIKWDLGHVQHPLWKNFEPFV